MSAVLGEVEEALACERGGGVVRLPALVRGRLVLAPVPDVERVAARGTDRSPGAPAERTVVDGAYAIRRPVLDPVRREATGAVQTLLLPAVDPASLIEPDRAATMTLMKLPFSEILDYVGALGDALADRPEVVRAVTEVAGATSPTGLRAGTLHVELMRGLLRADALADAVDRDLAGPGVPGRRYLDEWVPTGAGSHSGLSSQIRRRLFDLEEPAPSTPRLRALPTRQLHISSGNSPVVALVSAMRAIATKSPAVVKSSSETFLAAALLGIAMHSVDPDHPITRHTSLVCWPGGDRRIEDALLSAGGFDRLVAWGSAETVASLRARAPAMRTIFLEPRTGVSLIGRQALREDLHGVAARAASDSLADNQQACTASLVHYVEATTAEALEYCEALRVVLGRWDAAVPHVPARESLGRLRWLRRGQLARSRWFTNTCNGVVTSSVVCVASDLDVSAHPAGRCIVVRPVDDLAEAVRLLDPAISTVGIAPETRREQLRDAVANQGVSSVLALGEAERAFAGMPHDGIRILSELVSWATA